MQIIDDTINFLKTLSFVDVVFFFAVLALMLLIIVLIYFIRENHIEEDNNITFNNNLPDKKIDDNQENSEITSLKEITEALEQAEPGAVILNKYEEEQEEKAIISYEELLKRKNDFAINYSEEENLSEDLTVKKVDLDNLINKDVSIEPNLKVSVISYEKEEAFLEALKQLQQKLN